MESRPKGAFLLPLDSLRTLLRAVPYARIGSLALAVAFIAPSANGSLLTPDTSFGTNGSQRVGLVPANSRLVHVRPLPAGGWMALGDVAGRKVMTRYHASGALDLSFGTRGVLELTSLPSQVGYGSFELDAAGRWLIGGFGTGCASRPCVFRLNTDGSLDATFANGGAALPPGNQGADAGQILPLPGGGMLVAGQTSGGTGVLRLLADGTVDAAFGTNGITILPARPVSFFVSTLASPLSLRPASTGGFYVATDNYYVSFPYVREPDLHRLDGDGHPDVSFGTGGTLKLSVSGVGFGQIEELSGGKFIGSRTANLGGGTTGNQFLFQFDAAGTLDATFGVNGQADSGLAGFSYGGGPTPRFARQGLKYLVPGSLGGRIALARMNADGSPDLTFGAAGIFDSTIGGRAGAVSTGLGNELLALCTYGSTVAATLHVDAAGTASLEIGGIAEPLIDDVSALAKLVKPVFAPNGRLAMIGNGTDGALAVLEANGLPAASFGSGGHVLAADLGLPGALWTAAAYQTDNQLIVAGYRGSNNIVLRLDANGIPDATFGGTGIVQYQSGGGIARAAAAAVQPDGMVVTAAVTSPFIALQRFTSLGAPDSGFGVNGESDLPGALPFLNVSAVLFPGGGKILVAGVAQTSSSYRWFVVRLLANGMLDPSYGGGGGVAYIAAGTYMSNQVAAALQADGSVVLGGVADSIEVVARLTPAGQLDPAFGTGGVQALFAAASNRTSIAITDAGDTLIVASDPDANWLMMRITSNGHPDPLFGVELLSAFHATDQAIVATSGSRVVIAGSPLYGVLDARLLVHAYTVAATLPPLPQRTFAASFGSDSGPCAAAAPCRTLAKALAGTARGGEVLLLDSGNFGAAIIVASVSIVAPQNARPTVSADAGFIAVSISAMHGDTIVLRGLAVSGGTLGIVFNSGGSLHLENAIVRGYSSNSGANVWFQPATPARLSIKDSTIQSGWYGVQVTNGGGDVGVLLDNVRLEGNEEGLVVTAGGTASVRNSVVAGPGGIGIWVAGAGGVPLTATLDRVTITGTSKGLIAGGSDPATAFVRNSSIANIRDQGVLVGCCSPMSAVWIEGNRITGSGTGIELFAGGVFSRGNNTIEANGVDGAPTAIYSPK